LIHYLTYSEIDKSKWDDCISSSYNGIIYAYSWYLDIVCPGWEALVENDYEKVFPLTARKKGGINYLFQPVFTQQLGIFSKNKISEETIDEFFSKIPDKYKFIEINLNASNKPDSSKYDVKPNLTHELYLNAPYENLYKAYSDNTKRNIRQAINFNLSISKSNNADKIIEIFRHNKGKEIRTLKETDYNTLKKLIGECIQRKAAYILSVETKENNLCAGAILVESNKKAIFLFSAISPEAKSNGAMSFLIDSFIKEFSQHDLTLDFEGSNNTNLARFYKSFGSEECKYFQLRKNNMPWILSKSVTFIKWIRGLV
jgi:hypothetical protein